VSDSTKRMIDARRRKIDAPPITPSTIIVNAQPAKRASIRNFMSEGPTEDEGEDQSERWGNILLQAQAFHSNPHMGNLLWVDSRCVAAGMHPMDEVWKRHFCDFYESGKRIDAGRFGLRAAKSDSCIRATVAEVLMTQRQLEPGQAGVCPIISANMSEASDRFDTAVKVLAACGLREAKRNLKDKFGFQQAGGGTQGHTIFTFDSQGHPVEMRIYSCSVAGVIGYTGIAGFFDELDKWGKDLGANPAERVMDLALQRYTTQPTARVHAMSASYFEKSYHRRMIDEGDTPLQRVARLGLLGARRDEESRKRLYEEIKDDPAQKGNPDLELLLEPADPMSVDIPCWVTNPVAPIEECYKSNKGRIRQMLALSGGRAAYNVGVAGVVNFDGLAEANLRLQSSDRGRERTIDGAEHRYMGDVGRCYDGPSHDPRSFSHGRGRGVL